MPGTGHRLRPRPSVLGTLETVWHQPFRHGLEHVWNLFMVSWGMVYDCLVVYSPPWKIYKNKLGWLFLFPRYGKIKAMFQTNQMTLFDHVLPWQWYAIILSLLSFLPWTMQPLREHFWGETFQPHSFRVQVSLRSSWWASKFCKPSKVAMVSKSTILCHH